VAVGASVGLAYAEHYAEHQNPYHAVAYAAVTDGLPIAAGAGALFWIATATGTAVTGGAFLIVGGGVWAIGEYARYLYHNNPEFQADVHAIGDALSRIGDPDSRDDDIAVGYMA